MSRGLLSVLSGRMVALIPRRRRSPCTGHPRALVFASQSRASLTVRWLFGYRPHTALNEVARGGSTRGRSARDVTWLKSVILRA